MLNRPSDDRNVITLQEVELGVLGPLQVRQYGLPVAIPGAKPRAILTMLGLHGGSVVSADALVALLWGDEPPRTATKALQTHISSLRRALGDGFVLTEGTGWTLSTTEIDAVHYKTAAKLGRKALTAGDPTRAVALFDQALALWRGLPELPDSARGSSEKTRWLEGHAALVEDRADALLATGRAAEIVGELELAIAEAPLRERRWGHLMLALYRAGRQGEALGAYKRARSLLAEELGVDPGPELRRLEAAIVAQDASLEMPQSQQLSTVTRAVTFLLTDIEGSTAAWEADADAMAVALARHDEIVEQVVTSRGGRLIKTRGEGDATFSVFDRPSAAAAAAIELQEAIGHEAWQLADPMRIRVALHTGEVELRDGDYFGRAVNRAARLRSLAAGGQILCSGATAELVIDSLPDDVVLADLGTRRLRNLPRPEHVFELRLESVSVSAPPTAEAPMERPALPAVLVGPGPFVGRGRELERLVAAWQSTLAAGTRAVLIAGEPGVGKTRLAGEWSRNAYDQGAVVLYGRCDEDLGAPYQPFAEALRAFVSCVDSNRLRNVRGIEALLPLIPGLADKLPDVAAPPRADPDTERYALFDAVVALLGTASATAPVVLILDDLHWAAKPTLLLLRHLLRFGEEARVQIVGTYRSTDLDRSHPLAAMLADLHRDGTATRLQLSGLDEGDVTAYVAEAGYDDEELGRALATVTGGNPFFLIEALRHVEESGGRWDPSTLPQGVREAVSRRLSRLSAETNKALAAAAVVGSRFAVTLVEQVVGEDLVDAFDEAGKAGIVIEEPGGRYRFNHALVRQSLLAELPSVRRMRLHQRIAGTLEAEAGSDDELLAELAYHYFECAWAGNAAKAVEYCRRAADQAMSRVAYEGAAELYDRALHALEELDEELSDRDELQAELLIAHCEALLAAGDVTSAKHAVAQLRQVAVDSGRLGAWGVCFDGELSMLTDPERLDEIETAVSVAAEQLAALEDAAGEAKAHTVRAGCLARLGRIGDCETALDQALTAARRAHEHSRVNAVLAGAPLAALWGPNPVPRAGGRCLDVVRLLRITTGSPLVEATSTRCQAVLDAFRGRAAEGRRLIESARRTLTELGLRHALLEVDQFAGIIELVSDDAAAAEPYLRRAYEGFRRMGLDTDTADTAALLARTCLALERDAEADELCSVSERLAGHGSKASSAWRSVRAQLLARAGDHDRAKEVAEEAVSRAAATDALVDHGDACLALATVLRIAGNNAGMRAAAEQAVALYERKGAAALTEKARKVLGSDDVPRPNQVERPAAELTNRCVEVGQRIVNAIQRKAWDEFESLFVPGTAVESRRRIVGFTLDDLPGGDWVHNSRRIFEASGNVRVTQSVIAVRGERLALARLFVGSTDVSPGAPQDELLQIYGIDDSGRVSLQVWFDAGDLDDALAELDAINTRLGSDYVRAPLQNGASRSDAKFNALFAARRWDDIAALLADDLLVEDRRRGLGREGSDRATELQELRTIADLGTSNMSSQTIAVRGDRLALVRTRYSGRDMRPEAFHTELLRIAEIDDDGLLVAYIAFDLDDLDAALWELDTRYGAGEAEPFAQTWSTVTQLTAAFNRHDFSAVNRPSADHRRLTRYAPGDLTPATITQREFTPDVHTYIEAVHRLSDRGVVATYSSHGTGQGAFEAEWRVINILLIDDDHLQRYELFDEQDVDAALARFDELTRSRQQLQNAATRVHARMTDSFADRDWNAAKKLMAEDVSVDDRRRLVNSEVRQGPDATIANMRAGAQLGAKNIASIVIAIRGDRLALFRTRYSGSDQKPEAFHMEDLTIVEVGVDERIRSGVIFEVDDLDAAFTELDARYTAGDAAPYARTWTVIAKGYAGLNRDELAPTTPGWVNVDRRRLAPITAGRLGAYIRTSQVETPDLDIHIEAVHRISELGAVVTRAVTGTSREGFYAEWREVDLITVDGELVSRCEIFDEADLDVALAEFEQLNHPRPHLRNAASQAAERFRTFFVRRDWDALKVLLTDESLVEDRRQVVSSPLLRGRDDEIANLQAMADIGITTVSSAVIAVRGGRLALSRTRFSGADDFHADVLDVVEIDNEGRLVGYVCLDPDDFDAAFEELEARYIAGKAASHARTWSVVTGVFASLARHEVPPSTPDWLTIDHRRGTPLAGTDLGAVVASIWDITPDLQNHIETVHRLDDHGALCMQVSRGTTPDGFPAEWRMLNLMTVDDSMVSGCELFDETDLETAIARFEELGQPVRQIENVASRAGKRFLTHLAADDWEAIASLFADDYYYDDRRRTVNSGVRQGKAHALEDIRSAVDIGLWGSLKSEAVAIRGERFALTHFGAAGRDPGASRMDVLQLIETNADELFVAVVVWDIDEIDAAFHELERRYLADEASAHAHAWSVIAGAYAAVLRHELPPTTPDWVNVDHRRVTPFAPNELAPFLKATWDVLEEDLTIYVEAVHRLTDIGAVVTRVIKGTSREGFTAEWREIGLSTVEGDSINRSELFDETDLDVALARFEELNQPAVLKNTASDVIDRYCAAFGARDWAAMAETLADEVITDDRRRVVNAGVRQGRNVHMADSQAAAEVGGAQEVASALLATRGGRLALIRVRTTNSNTPPGEFGAQMLGIVEIDTDDRIAVTVCLDEEDVDAAFQELDARYLTGEASAYAQTWSAIAGSFTAVSRGEFPDVTPDFINLDHRRAVAFAPGELGAYTRAAHGNTTDFRAYIEAVHRLNAHGAVVSYVARGASPQGFQAEWRGVSLSTVDEGLVNRTELYDETDIESALAHFDELDSPTTHLENTATRVYDRFETLFLARNWSEIEGLLSPDHYNDDRRPLTGAGLRRGPDAEMAELRTAADEFTSLRSSSVDIAVRGERLALRSIRYSGRDKRPGASVIDVLTLIETDANEKLLAIVVFNTDGLDSAIDELEARYLAGEAAACAHTWSVIVDVFAAVNTYKLPQFAPDWVTVDHRRSVAFAPGEMAPYANAAQQDMPDATLYIEAVHRLNDLGAVVTYVARGTSTEGFQAEWREVSLSTVDGGRVNRSELFDLADLDDALARFDELTRPAPRSVNAAYQMVEQLWKRFDERDWTAIGELLALDIYAEDRRRIINDGTRRGREAFVANMRAVAEVGTGDITSTLIATRGQRLVLARIRSERFHTDVLNLVELDAGQQAMTSTVVFDGDDLDAAVTELDSRFEAGEAAPHGRTWTVLAKAYAAFNRHELPATTPDWVNIDHRSGTSIAPGQLFPYVRTSWELSPDIINYIKTVHRLNDFGAVVTRVATGTSQEGFLAEWRVITLATFDGDLLSRVELFDETDLDAAVARFEELNRSTPTLTNTATRAADRFCECFGTRDWGGMADTLAESVRTDDNRPLVGVGRRRGPQLNVADWQAVAEVGTQNLASTVIAVRGQHLALSRFRTSGRDQRPEAFHTEILAVIETEPEGRIEACVMFDRDDLDAAFAELDARYLAGEAARYAEVWSGIAGAYASYNRCDIPSVTNWMTVDHRVRETFAGEDLTAYIRSAWDVTPNNKMYVECVHRLSDRGAVITHTAYGNSPDGFYAEWRMIALLMMNGRDGTNRCDLFEEADLDNAIAKFDELSDSAHRPVNGATRALARAWACFEDRDWDATQLVMAEDFTSYDRRQVVNAGVRRGRKTHIENMRSVGEVGFKNAGFTVIATRGEHLALVLSRFAADEMPRDEIVAQALMVIETNAANRLISNTVFDLDDVDAAFAELDAMYASGEAAAHARTWTVVTQGYAALNRHEHFDRGWAFADHRKGTPFASTASAAAGHPEVWDVTPDLTAHIEVVHHLSDEAVLVTSVVGATSRDGFEAEWRFIQLLAFAGVSVERCELFDEADIEVALARIAELSRSEPRLDNAAVRVRKNVANAYNRRDTETFTAGAVGRYEDRRRGLRDEGVTDAKYAHAVLSETPTSWKVKVEPVAIRGDRLALTREAFLDNDDPTRPITVELVVLTDVADKQEDLHTIFFDPEDTDAAYAELDRRFLAGEAAPYARTWSAIAESYAMVNRHEAPGTTPAWVDHRLIATIEPADLTANLRAAWDMAPDIRFRIATVHRLTKLGAVIDHTVQGHSDKGFPFDYRELALVTVDGDRTDRFEMFDAGDLDAAFARLDELSRASRIENAVTRVWASVADAFNRRDLDGYLKLVSAERQVDDRRKGLQALIAGPDQRAHVVLLFELAPRGWVMEVDPIAARGTRLALVRTCWIDGTLPERPVTNELLVVTEVGADGLIDLIVAFDPADTASAIQELESRYLAGEAAPYSHTWSLLLRLYDAYSRHQLSSLTADWEILDHRQGIASPPGDLFALTRAAWETTPELTISVAAVHRLSKLGALVTASAHGVSRDGFSGEWRDVHLFTFDGDAIKRCEIFDEDDLDTALARFEELSEERPRLANTATRMWERLADAFNHHDVDAFLTLTSPTGCIDDRRKGLQALHGPSERKTAALALFESPLTWRTEVVPVAIRGTRLALARQIYRDTAEESRPITVDILTVVEINDDGLMGDFVNFDSDDIDAAFEELETRYLAGEAAAHARTWSAIVDGYATFNRRELFRTTPDWVNIDHRRGGTSFGPGEQIDFVNATWDVVPKIRAHAEAVHRLDTLGAVVTQVVKATSHAGFDGEWRELVLLLIDGDAISRCEMFDETDLDAALARCDELNRQAHRLANSATRVRAHLVDAFGRRDLDAFCSFLTPDGQYNDCRKGLRDEGLLRQDFARTMLSEAPDSWQWTYATIAIRGEHLALCRDWFRDTDAPGQPVTVDDLSLTEVTEGGLVCHSVIFDSDDLDAAMRELDARWIASGKVEHPEVIETILGLFEAANRRDWEAVLAAHSADATFINHRQLTTGRDTIADYWSSIRAFADLVPDMRFELAGVLSQTSTGVVCDIVVAGTSSDGLTVELPLVAVLRLDEGHVTHIENFEPAERKRALERFEQLNASA